MRRESRPQRDLPYPKHERRRDSKVTVDPRLHIRAAPSRHLENDRGDEALEGFCTQFSPSPLRVAKEVQVRYSFVHEHTLHECHATTGRRQHSARRYGRNGHDL